MTNPFRVAPQAVQWAAFCLLFIPVFDAVVILNGISFSTYLEYWPYRVLHLGVTLGLAGGLLYGLNLVRILFVALFLISAASDLYRWYHLGFPSTNLLATVVFRALPCLAVILCFMPSANRYFRRRASDENRAEGSTAAEETHSSRPLINLTLVLLALGGTFLLARFIGPDQRIQNAQLLANGNNLRMLQLAAQQAQLEEPGRVPKFSDLVGQTSGRPILIPQFKRIADEKYPEQFPFGVEPVAVLPDGSVVSLDAAGVPVRGPANKQRPAVSAVTTPPPSQSTAQSVVATPPVVRSIVGRWEWVKPDEKSPIKSWTMTFDVSGALHARVEVTDEEAMETKKVEGTYTLDANTLTTTVRVVGASEEKQTTTFQVTRDGERLVLDPGDGTLLRFVPQPPK